MKTIMKFLMYGLLIFTMAFTSCSKDGDIGPQGEPGVAGTNGTDGNNGTDGIDGNANVQLYTLDIPNVTGSAISINFDVLTPEVLSENIILLYLKDGNRLNSVPGRGKITVAGTAPDIYFNTTSRLAGTGNANIRIFYTDLDGAPFSVSGFHYNGLNVFIIKPSAILTGKTGKPDFTKMSYEEVITYFNIKE